MSGAPIAALALTEPNLTTSRISKKEQPQDIQDSKELIKTTMSSSNLKNPVVSSRTARSTKRSSSISNDFLYERDRFRARLHSLNINPEDDLDEDDDETCEVCDIIGSKTTKLNVKKDDEISPLSSDSQFFNDLEDVDLYEDKFNVKLITFEDLQTIFHWYFKRPLPPTTSMFPWLHGLHLDNFAQRKFFIQQQRQRVDTGFDEDRIDLKPNARFLMTINSDLDHNLSSLRNSTMVNEILCPIDIAKTEVKDLVDKILLKTFGGYKLRDVVMDDIYSVNYLPIFLNLDPDSGVSLRNFHIQVTKSAICSDFIVYCFNEKHLQKCYSIGRLLWIAQKLEEPNNNELNYNVFILKQFKVQHDEHVFSVSLDNKVTKNYDVNKLIKLNLNYLKNWDNEYTIKERIETLKMSSATKVTGSLFSGNSWDYQNFLNFKHSTLKDKVNKKYVDLNNLYCNPSNSIVTCKFNTSDLIETILPLPNLHYKLFIGCFNEAKFPDDASLESLLKVFSESKELGDYYYLSFPSSGSIGIGDLKRESIISLLNVLKLMYLVSFIHRHDVLVYCSDGYTESSLLNLCYLMYSNNCSLSEAILDFHIKYGRPFYIFNTDVQILGKLEPILRKFSPLTRQVIWDKFENLSTFELNELLLCSSSISKSISLTPSLKDELFDFELVSSDSSTSYSSTESIDEPDWVKEVDGSLPSRILPYLYLGSLKHANCLPLISRLGITKVISVGEPLDWLSGSKFQENNNISIDESNDGDIEVYNITPRLHRHKHSCPVDQVMKVNNLQDDGIDQSESSLPEILKFIDDEYNKSNGQTKILIHCRVGVSRSATVVIAEVMKRLKINLPKAYLYVRVRRLNIIIQPNLMFMYELFKWEEVHKHHGDLREIDWFAMCREITLLNTPYLTN